MGIEGLDVAPDDKTKDDGSSSNDDDDETKDDSSSNDDDDDETKDDSSSNDDDDESPAREFPGYRGARLLASAKNYFTGPQSNIIVVTRKLNIGYAEGLLIHECIDEDKMNLLSRAHGLLTNGGSSPLELDWACPGIEAEECKAITKSWQARMFQGTGPGHPFYGMFVCESCCRKLVRCVDIDRANARTGTFSEDEDIKLKYAVQTHCGKNWGAIAALVPDRAKTQCNKRWYDALKPSIGGANARTGTYSYTFSTVLQYHSRHSYRLFFPMQPCFILE
jgi:hypothetical protein